MKRSFFTRENRIERLVARVTRTFYERNTKRVAFVRRIGNTNASCAGRGTPTGSVRKSSSSRDNVTCESTLNTPVPARANERPPRGHAYARSRFV